MKAKNVFTNLIKNVSKFTNEHSSEILAGTAIIGVVTTTVLGIKATPKAIELMRDAELEKGDDLTKKEIVKACWKCYIPTAVGGALTVATICGMHNVNHKKNLALATMYKATEAAFIDYKNAVVNEVGKEKEKEISTKVKESRNIPSDASVIIAGDGEVLCYDEVSGRYFSCDSTTLKKAENYINHKMLNENNASINDFWDEVGLAMLSKYEIGWSIAEGMVELEISSMITENGKPCLSIGFSRDPKQDYAEF
jgi:hypothetical protein